MMKRLFCWLVLLAVAFSCAQPDSTETFVKARDAQGGMYSFDLDMTDSLMRYDLAFFTRVDGVKTAYQQQLHVVWISPSEKVYEETVYMNIGASGESREAYRSEIEPSEYGIWNLRIFPVDAPEGMCGMGLICNRTTE